MKHFSKISCYFRYFVLATFVLFLGACMTTTVFAQTTTPASSVVPYDRILCVKFQNDLPVYVEKDRLSDRGSGLLAPLSALLEAGVYSKLIQHLSDATIDSMRYNAQRFWEEEARKDPELKAGVLADMNNYFVLHLYNGVDKEAVMRGFKASPLVEDISTMPTPVAPPTPGNYVGMQTYLNANSGINANQVYSTYNNRGEGMQIVDIEGSFNTNHADLPNIPLVSGTNFSTNFDNHHGTAVLGEIVSKNNGWGTTGIASASTAKFAGNNPNIANAIMNASTAIQAGDVILIEQQIGGPYYVQNSNGDQFGMVPVEYYQPYYMAVKTVTGNNRIVVEAAGNGSQNLDASLNAQGNANHYPFSAANNSGAIIVGAGCSAPTGTSTPRSRLSFSNYGSRLDVQAFGENVCTTGSIPNAIGDLYSAEGENYWYTAQFGGTSSASPIVAGACLLIQSVYKSNFGGSILSPIQMRSLLIATGQAQQSGSYPVSQKIGPLPNAYAAIQSVLSASACNAPSTSQISASSITTTTARINCSVTGVQSYGWRYRKVGVSTWTDLANSTNSYFDVTGLTANTQYEFLAKVRCNATVWSAWSAAKTFTTSAVATCAAPSTAQISATNITATTVRLNCSVTGVQAYDWIYRKVGNSTWTELPGGSPAYINVSGLTQNTQYEFAVAVRCDASTWSSWSSTRTFTTSTVSVSNDNPCSAIQLTAGSSCSSTSSSTAGATATYSGSTCGTTSPLDVWFKCAIPSSGYVTFRTTAGSLSDAVMAVYWGSSCSSPTYITCEDDNSNGNGSAMPTIAITGQAGTMLWVRVWGYENSTGSFSICALNYNSTNLSGDDGSLYTVTPTQLVNAASTVAVESGDNSDPAATDDRTIASDNLAAKVGVIFPNPAATQASIAYTLPAAGTVQITICDLLGKVMQAQTFEQESGDHLVNLDLSGLVIGAYIVRFQTGDSVKVQQMQVVR